MKSVWVYNNGKPERAFEIRRDKCNPASPGRTMVEIERPNGMREWVGPVRVVPR